MKAITRIASPLSLFLYAVLSSGQLDKPDTPLKASMCDLYEHPEQYAGRMVEIRANVSGIDLVLDDFSSQKSCTAYMRLHLEFPAQVKPTPGFDVLSGEAYNELFERLRRGMNVIATYEGRFDPLFVWRDHKRVRVGDGTDQGYGRNNRYDGRIVLRTVSDVQARPMPRR